MSADGDTSQFLNKDYITISVIIKKFLPVSRRTLARMCEEGVFKTAFKPGNGGKTSQWKVLRAEVIQHKVNAHPNPYY